MDEILKAYQNLFRQAKENGLIIYLLHKNCSQEFVDNLLSSLPTPDLYDLMRICKNPSPSRVDGLDYNLINDKI